MRVFLISVLFLLGHLIYAQQYQVVEGRVIDSKTQKPLPFCSVFIKGEVVGTVANAEGSFKLSLPKSLWKDTLVVSHVGYKNFYSLVKDLPKNLSVKLQEAPLDLDAIQVEADRLTAQEIFENAVEKIKSREGYPNQKFRMDGFFREEHQSEGEQTGVLECAISVFGDDVTTKFKDIAINQFRKVYDRKQNTDQFIDTKEGHNHLLLLLNNGINLIPLAKRYKSSVWKLPLEIKELTYFNDRLVYVLANEKEGRILKVYVDVEDYTVYKNELILKAEEEDFENYAWGKMNSKGEECGAIYDHQSYEYRMINGKLFPYYAFRRFDFRCYAPEEEKILASAYLKKELLINNVQYDPIITATDKLRKKQGLINRKEPYDSAFWKHFNDIQATDVDVMLYNSPQSVVPQNATKKSRETPEVAIEQVLKIGDHAMHQFTRADTLYGTLTPELACYDVNHYDLDLKVDPVREIIKGIVTMSFQMLKSTRSLRIDLLEYLTIDRITCRGIEVPFERDLDAVYLTFENPLMARGNYAIKVHYRGHPLETSFGDQWTGGFMWRKDSEGNPFAQTLCQGYGAKGWFPVKNHLSDEPDSVDIRVELPTNLIAVANGKLISKESLGETSRVHWKTSNPINTYDVAIHIGTYDKTSSTYPSSSGEELSMDYYFLAQDTALASRNLEMVPKMMEVYEHYFGPYPFQSDGFKVVQSPYPMEHQSCVAVGPYFDDFLILHETAHEWWGNNVSISDNADIWIHEAFATYAESLYLEATLGYEMGQKYLNSRKNEILNDHPLLGVRHVNHFHYRIEDKYTKGSLMINTLRHVVDDDELWFETLKAIQEDFRHSFIDTETLINYLELQLELDLTSFFEQYLITTKVPTLELKKNNGAWQYRWVDSVDAFNMPIRVSGVQLLPSTAWQEASISLNDKDVADLQSAFLIRVNILAYE